MVLLPATKVHGCAHQRPWYFIVCMHGVVLIYCYVCWGLLVFYRQQQKKLGTTVINDGVRCGAPCNIREPPTLASQWKYNHLY